ncbi:MAG: hypothetical protein LW832_03570 [Parachlamydia sp.]|jgi:hypothetical protein|nr:hypothetical protein [Parachlamydia sp.]
MNTVHPASFVCYPSRPERFYIVSNDASTNGKIEKFLIKEGVGFRLARQAHTVEIFQPHLFLIKVKAEDFWKSTHYEKGTNGLIALFNSCLHLPNRGLGWALMSQKKGLSLSFKGPSAERNKSELLSVYGSLINIELVKEWIFSLPLTELKKNELTGQLKHCKFFAGDEAFQIPCDLMALQHDIKKFKYKMIYQIKALREVRSKNVFPSELMDLITEYFLCHSVYRNYLFENIYNHPEPCKVS